MLPAKEYVFIQSLKLYNFRNFKDEKITLAPGANVIIGRNAQGKTNLVEAVSLLSSGRSFRTSKLHELIAWGEAQAAVFGSVVASYGDLELGVCITDQGRKGCVNGGEGKGLGDYLGRLLCVTFTPSDLELIKGGPSERRRFLDRHLTDLEPKLLAVFHAYGKALRSKTKLLVQGGQSAHNLEPWNTILAENAAIILQARKRLIASIAAKINHIHNQFALEDGTIELALKSDLLDRIEILSAAAIFDELQKKAAREIDQRRNLLGPQLDDLLITVSGQPARAFASQGQTRSLVLSLKLCVIELLEESKGESPVVLLDDVDSELDEMRSSRLLTHLLNAKRQILITGTDAQFALKRLPISPSAMLEVQEGKIVRAP